MRSLARSICILCINDRGSTEDEQEQTYDEADKSNDKRLHRRTGTISHDQISGRREITISHTERIVAFGLFTFPRT